MIAEIYRPTRTRSEIMCELFDLPKCTEGVTDNVF